MRYLADVLTMLRLILASIICFFALSGASPSIILVLFVAAELTDAFDGACATKWPFKKDQAPAYRRYAVKYDMFADVFLWFATVLYLTLQLNHVIGAILLFGTPILCGTTELWVYGKLFGHPDDCTKKSLCKRNFRLAKKIIMTRRFFYLATIIVAIGWLLCASGWSLTVKIFALAIGIIIGIFLWFFLKPRRQHISRDAIAIEQKL